MNARSTKRQGPSSGSLTAGADGARRSPARMRRLSHAHPCLATLRRARTFWALQLEHAALHGSACGSLGAEITDEQNAACAPGETRLCFEFTNLGRCRHRKCTFRHVLPEHPDAADDATRRGR